PMSSTTRRRESATALPLLRDRRATVVPREWTRWWNRVFTRRRSLGRPAVPGGRRAVGSSPVAPRARLLMMRSSSRDDQFCYCRNRLVDATSNLGSRSTGGTGPDMTAADDRAGSARIGLPSRRQHAAVDEAAARPGAVDPRRSVRATIGRKPMRPLRIPVLGAVLSLVATAFIGPAVAVASETETAAEILREGAQLGVDNGYPGVIGLVRDGTDTAYVQAGLGDRFTRVPADPQARFRIGSNTKAFIATVLLQLEAEDRLSLDDTLDTWLPDVFARSGHDGSTITVRQLLNHTSGLPEYLNDPRVLASYAANLNPYRKWEPRKLVEIALRQGATGAPGERHSYSNTNYLLAGMVIEAVTGNPPHVEVRQRIISPLGLHDTSFPTDPRPQGEWLRGYFRI